MRRFGSLGRSKYFEMLDRSANFGGWIDHKFWEVRRFGRS
jgi:hypothetical protein